MHRAHELIANLIPGREAYLDANAAIKFDLGEVDAVDAAFNISRREIFKLPAPICLFQVTQGFDLHMFLSKESAKKKIV